MQDDGAQLQLPAQRKRSDEQKGEDRKSDEEGKHESNGNSPIEDEDGIDGVKSDKDSFQVESEEEARGSEEKRVQFKEVNGESQENTQASQTRGIDLPVLWRNQRQGEIVYKLTELYRYTNQQQR